MASLLVVIATLAAVSLANDISCSTASHLPIPLAAYELVYFKSNQTIYLFGGMTVNSYNSVVPFMSALKWDMTVSSQPAFESTNISFPAANGSINTPSGVSSVVIDNYAYFVGLFLEHTIYRFDINTQSFDANFSRMIIPGLYGCVTTNKTHIFMVGGFVRHITLNITQIYDIQKDEWSMYPIDIVPLSTSGILQSMCIMIDQSIYIFGGVIGPDPSANNIHDGIYKVTWPQNEWSKLGFLATPTACGSMVYHCDTEIIISGGLINAYDWSTDSIQTYDIHSPGSGVSQQHHVVASLGFISGVIVDDKMYIFGGVGKSIVQNAVQMCVLDDSVCKYIEVNMEKLLFIIGGICLGLCCICVVASICTCYRYKRTSNTVVSSDEQQNCEKDRKASVQSDLFSLLLQK